MALRRLLQSELLNFHYGSMQRVFTSERLLSSAIRPALDDKDQEGSRMHSEPKRKLITPFRTSESDPRQHTESHIARYYTLPEELKSSLFKLGGFPKKFQSLCHTFTETCIMVRRPFLEIKQYIETVDFTKPTVRIVMYGNQGLGKSMTLAHLIHYGHAAGFMLVHVPWVNDFMRRSKGMSPSETKPGMMDVPIDGAEWLVHFKSQNGQKIQQLQVKTTKSYQYGPADTVPNGAPLLELIEFGISRSKYSCSVVEDLLQEIKYYSNKGLFKTMVVIDGFNGLYCRTLRTARRQLIDARCTLALPFLEITKFDWCNGIVVVTVDQLAYPGNAESVLPLYLLGKEGWEHLDPFIPVEVEKMDDAEMNSMLDYYIDRKWIQHHAGHSEEGKAELRFLCGGNGYQLMKLCSPL